MDILTLIDGIAIWKTGDIDVADVTNSEYPLSCVVLRDFIHDFLNMSFVRPDNKVVDCEAQRSGRVWRSAMHDIEGTIHW